MRNANNNDRIGLLENVKQEIQFLRQRNTLLEGQIFVVEIFARALGFKETNRGMGEDITWKLNEFISILKKEEEERISKIIKPTVADDDGYETGD